MQVWYTRSRGFSVVEVLVGLSIFVVIFLFIYETLTLYFTNHRLLLEKTEALLLAEAGQEYVRYMRDEDWAVFTGLTTGTKYYFDISTTSIETSASPILVDGKFTPAFVLWPAYRNGDDDLVASTTFGAVADPDSFLVNTMVTWGDDEEVWLQSFLGNLKNN